MKPTPQILDYLLEQMAEYTFPFLASIIKINTQDTGMLLGTGSYLSWLSRVYLLSAGHVLQKPPKPALGLAAFQGNGQPPRLLESAWNSSDAKNELDVGFVSAQLDLCKLVVPLSQIAMVTPDLSQDLLFLHGYLGTRSKQIIDLKNETFPYLSALGETKISWFKPNMHFCVAFPRKQLKRTGGRPVGFEAPKGLSGSLVWKLNWTPCFKSVADLQHWQPSNAQVVGVIHTWDPHSDSLIATRIEYVTAFLNSVDIMISTELTSGSSYSFLRFPS